MGARCRVASWEPAALVETVKISGTTHIQSAASVFHALLTQVGWVGEWGGGGAGQTGAPGQTNLHFNEAHVFPFPQLLPGPCDGCVTEDLPEVLQVHYLSEIDSLWRLQPGNEVSDPLSWIGLGTLGTWAHWYPRVGFAIHGSEPVGSAIAAARALHIANNPVDAAPLSPGTTSVRPVITPSPVSPLCIQLARPVPTACFPVGTTPAFWETGTVSPRGEYIWLFWRYRTCCVDPATSLCGIASIGGTGANVCLLGP